MSKSLAEIDSAPFGTLYLSEFTGPGGKRALQLKGPNGYVQLSEAAAAQLAAELEQWSTEALGAAMERVMDGPRRG